MEKSDTEEKAELRRKFLQLRREIPSLRRQAWDEDLCRQILDHPAITQSKTVFAYLSRNGEADTRQAISALLHAGKRVLTPSPDIKALPHDGLFKICFNRQEACLAEPEICGESRIDQLDAIIVPGVIWDLEGYRVGFGGGYFDRLLEMARPDCVSLGLAYPVQVISRVPRQPWDRKVSDLLQPAVS